MRPILCYTNSEAANSAIASLASSGIEASVSQHSAPSDGSLFSVSVLEPEERAALDIVLEAGKGTGAIHCPSCNEINVEYPAAPQASPTMKMAEMVIDVLGGNKHDFMCRKCNHIWS